MTNMKTNKILITIVILIFITSIILSYIILNHEEIMGITHGPYDVIIERNYNNESEQELISIAENITPPDGSWWFMEFDNILIADCVNKEAIRYYTDLINNIEDDHRFTGFDIKNAYFKYKATIDYIDNPGIYNTSIPNLIEVNLTIEFNEYVDPINALWFDHFRCVIFDHNKEIITVLGDDEEPVVLVS